MNRAILVVAACTVAWCGPCLASEWWFLAESGGDGIVFIDTQSIAKSGNLLTAWFSTHYKNEQKHGIDKNYKSTKSLYVFNCTSRESGAKQLIYYDSNGAAVDTFAAKKPEMFDIAPDTVGEKEINVVCGKVSLKNVGVRMKVSPAVAAENFYSDQAVPWTLK